MSSASAVAMEAMQLARQERADLARALIASLDDEGDQDVEAAWLGEVERRVQTAEHGTAQFEPWEVVEQRIAARLRCRRINADSAAG
jgi:putative addiction module component (TIGR02574 family)